MLTEPKHDRIQVPITDLLDQDQGYGVLLQTLHPDRLHCPNGHPLPQGQALHDRKRAPLVKYRCRSSGAVFNLFTGTLWSGTRYHCATGVMVLRGFAQGTATLHLARELSLDYSMLLERRHRLQGLALQNCDKAALPDEEVEADELYQNAGEKGDRHADPADPPRRRANKRRGRGTYQTTVRRCWGWSGERADKFASKSVSTPSQRRYSPQLNRRAPKIQYVPKIIDFLGYVPFSMGSHFLRNSKRIASSGG